jgi:C1A family cysteine protease
MALKPQSNLIPLDGGKNVTLLKGGYVKDKIDVRDYVYRVNPHVAAAVRLPVSSSLRSSMPPVLDQGNLGSCVSNAVCNALGFLNIKLKKPIGLKSRLFNYYNTRVLEGTVTQDSGCQIRDAVKASNKTGNCYETSWPYNIQRFTLKPPQQTYTEATQHKLTLYQRVNQDRISIKSCILTGYPVVIGFTCFNTLYNPSVERTGDILMPVRKDYIIGGHCVLITGYNDSTQRYEIQNSWGTDWGKQGYGTLPYAYVENPGYASDFWQMQKVP